MGSTGVIPLRVSGGYPQKRDLPPTALAQDNQGILKKLLKMKTGEGKNHLLGFALQQQQQR